MRKMTTQQILASAILMSASAIPAFGTAYTWNGGTDDTWTTTTNWSPTGLPGTGDSVNFVGSSNDAVNLNGDQSINAISFSDGNIFTLDTSGTVNNNTVTLDSGGSITKSSGVGSVTDTIYSAIAVNTTASITNNDGTFGGSDLVLAGNITGSGTITLNGTSASNGTGVVFEGDNSGFTGNIVANTGTYLQVKPATSTNNALGGSGTTVTMDDGTTFSFKGTAASNYAYAKASNNWVIAGSVAFNSYFTQGQSGNVTINNGASWNISDGGGNGLYLSGVISGQGTMDLKAGGEILEGTASNTLSGTIINESGSGRPQYGFNSLYLAKTGGAFAITGPLVVKTFGSVVLLGDQEIAPNIVPEIDAANPTSGGYLGVQGAGLQLRGHTQTLGGVTGTGQIEDEFLGNGALYFGASGVGTAIAPGTAASTVNEHGTLILDVTGTNSYTFAGTLLDHDTQNYYQSGGTPGNYYNSILTQATGVLALTKMGTGTQILTGNSTFTGATTISGGVLALQGTGSLGNTAISVTTGGTFAPNSGTSAGTGGASLSIAAGATFDMTGDNGGTLGKFTLTGSGTALTLSGGTLKFDVDSAGNNDQLLVTGDSGASVSGANLITIDITGDTSLVAGDYTLISDAAGGLVPADFSLTDPVVVAGANTYDLSLGDSTSTAEVLTVTAVAAVPEPASLGLLAMASVGLLGRRRRRTQKMG